MTYLFRAFYICLLFLFLLASCTTAHYEREQLEIDNTTSKIQQDFSLNGEPVAFEARIHFYLNLWENLIGQSAPAGGSSCNNDYIFVTDKNIYIYENYYDLTLTRFKLMKCSRISGSAVLRPQAIHKIPIDNITKIQSAWYKVWFEKYPTEFSVHYKNNLELDEIIYIAIPDNFHSERKQVKLLFNAINNHRNIAISDVPECVCSSPYAEHICYRPCLTNERDLKPSCRGLWFDWEYHAYLHGEKEYRNRVDCPEDIDFWSSNRKIADTLHDANNEHVLFIGDERYSGNCRPKQHYGYWSTKEFTISGCEKNWYRVGGRKPGPCRSMDGVKVRRYTVGDFNCYSYDN